MKSRPSAPGTAHGEVDARIEKLIGLVEKLLAVLPSQFQKAPRQPAKCKAMHKDEEARILSRCSEGYVLCDQSPVFHSRRTQVRLWCLHYIDQSRSATVMALLPLIQNIYADVKPSELDRALDYLELRGLLTVFQLGNAAHYRLSAQGIDHMELNAASFSPAARSPERPFPLRARASARQLRRAP